MDHLSAREVAAVVLIVDAAAKKQLVCQHVRHRRLRVWGVGFSVEGSGLRASDSGFRV